MMQYRQIKGYLIDNEYGFVDVVEVSDTLNRYKSLLDAGIITMPRAYLGLMPIRVICDYEGMKKNKKITAKKSNGDVYTRGPIFITGIDATGNLRSLTSSELSVLSSTVTLDLIEDGRKTYNGYILYGVSSAPEIDFISD